MATDRFCTMIVDDCEPWRRLVRSILQHHPEMHVVGEVSDGPEAVQQAREMQPDLILLDIGLPTLNGIEAARQIRRHSPHSKILFLSQESSAALMQEALRHGNGYVTKADAAHDLPAALHAVLRGEFFVGGGFATRAFTTSEISEIEQADDSVSRSRERNTHAIRRHEVGFYSDDQLLLDDVAQFIGNELQAGNGAIVAATERHRGDLLPRLKLCGIDIEAAVEQNRYIAVDAAEVLAQFMRDGMPDPSLLLGGFGNLIQIAANVGMGSRRRVAIYGECVHLLWAKGNPEAAVRMEQLGNELINAHDVDIRCAYSLGEVQGGMDDHLRQRICAAHSVIFPTGN